MCGIAGIWSNSAQSHTVLASRVDKMLSALRHRGPDDGGFAVDDHIAIGNRRLSIFDLSAAGHQPFFSEDSRVWLVFNGEIYNHVELRKELDAEFSFRSSTDTEVLLCAYLKWGIECLKRFNGMFAIGIWDASLQKLYLCRDRIGIKPLYYTSSTDELVFGSEIKALLSGGVNAEPDFGVLRDYLVDGYYDHSSRTFFKGISQVERGHYLEVDHSGIRQTCYWRLEPGLVEADPAVDSGQVEEEYEELLRDAVALRMRADVPYAVMLSGGLDSSVIGQLAADVLGDKGTLNVCTFRHADPKYDEGPWADLVSTGRGWQKHDIVLSEQHVLDLLPEALYHQDEPFGSVASFADILLAKQARDRGIYVLLEGQGADETLGGYEYYYQFYLADLYQKNPEQCWQAYKEYFQLRNPGLSPTKEGMLALVQRGQGGGKGLGQDGTVSIMAGVLTGDFLRNAPVGWTAPGRAGSYFNERLYQDLTATKVPRVLRFKDKASMMFGVELRVPFLDHRLVELAFRIPADKKLHGGYTKHCLRRMMGDRLPKETCFHVKRQIQTPQREWLRTTLRPLVEETISSASFAGRGIFDIDAVQSLYRDYLAHPENYPNLFFIWQWLQLEYWFRLFIDGSVVSGHQADWAATKNHWRKPGGVSRGDDAR